MTLRFAGKAPQLGGTASFAPFSFILLLGCATGDSPLPNDPSGGDAAQSLATADSSSGDVAQREAGEAAQGADAQNAQDGAGYGNRDATLDPDRDAPPQDDASDSAADAPAVADGGDGGDDSGVRCGGGAVPALHCKGATPLCCETSGAYACVAAGSCAGTSIPCAAAPDCAAGHQCCRYAAIKCEPTCPVDIVICDPNNSASCPSGHSCNVPVILSGSASPYMTCSP